MKEKEFEQKYSQDQYTNNNIPNTRTATSKSNNELKHHNNKEKKISSEKKMKTISKLLKTITILLAY